MPSNRALRSLRKPLSVLAIPGMYLVYKYTQYRRQQQEQQRKKATEKELQCLNHKIDKLLTTLDEHDSKAIFSEEDECVVCLCAKATMQTFPCGHRVVCRTCFVKTIQVAVSQRCLPLRCVVCRTRIYKLKQSRDVSPLTPPPSRHHTPWQHDHRAGSPSNRPHQQKGSSSGGRCSRSTSLAKQIFRGGANGGGVQTKRSDLVKSGSVQPKPVATKLMQPLLIFPQQSQGVPSPLTPITASKKDCVGDNTGGRKRKKQVRFASPIRCESPVRRGILHVDIIGATQCDQSSPKHILHNTVDSRIPTIKYRDCFSPRLARCSPSLPRDNTQTSIFGSPRLVFKHGK